MHEKSPVLPATRRERLGTRYTKRIREQGGLPAIVYGHKEEPGPVSVKAPSANVKIKTDKHAKVAQIVIQQEIVEEKPEEAVVEAGAAEPEVITAKKKEGEEGAEAEAGKGAAKPGAPGAKPAAGAKPA